MWWFFDYHWLQIKYDFLKHYNKGYNDLFEDKHVGIEKTAKLLKFEITVNKHGDYYNFDNSEEVADDFLKNVHSRFKPSGLKLIKCLIVIENIQKSTFEYKLLDNWCLQNHLFEWFYILWAEKKYFEQGNCKWYVG